MLIDLKPLLNVVFIKYQKWMAILILYILNPEFTVNIIIFTNVITDVYDVDNNGKYYNYCY